MTSRDCAQLVGWFLVTMVVSGSADVWAQSRSSINGTIRDGAGAALTGVTVTLQGVSVPGEPRTVLTNGRGEYRFPQLTPGVYDVTVTHSGLQTVKRAELRVLVGSAVTVDVTLLPASGPDAITIRRAAPMVDVTSAASTTKLTSEDLENLPIVRGVAILQLAPGVTPDTAFGSPLETSLMTADAGPITIVARGELQSAALHPYWMQEAQIFGVGAGTEHDEFSGVVANIALRSGSNRFSGLFEHRITPSRWVADNTVSLPEPLRSGFRAEEILSRWDSTVQAGGPIKRDRLFFFSGIHYDRNRVLQAGTIGPAPLDERSPSFVTRLAWVPRRALNADGFIVAHRIHAIGRRGPRFLPETANDQTWHMRTWNGHATWSPRSNVVLEFRAGGIKFDFRGIPPERRAGPPPRLNQFTQIRSGNVQQFQDLFVNRHLAGATTTWFLDESAGRTHAVELGFDVERTTHRQVTGFPRGQFFTDIPGQDGRVTLWAGDTAAADSTRMSMFLRDRFSIGQRVTLQPGVRLSINRGSVPDRGTVFKTSPVSPLISAAWDVAADHRTVMRAVYSRLHEGVSSPTLFAFMNTSGRTPRITARVVAPDTFVEINRQSPDQGVAVGDELAPASVDQRVVGIERELFPDFSLALQYVRRQFGDIWGLIDTGSQYAPVEARDPGPDGEPNTADDGALLTAHNLLNPGQSFTVLSNPDGAFRRYNAVQLIGQKRFSHNWQALAAYTWSRTRGNVNAGAGENRAGGTDTGRNGVFFNPNRRINADGLVASDYTHQLTLQGVYLLPVWGGIGLSAEYSYLSGGAWGRTAVLTAGVSSPHLLQDQTVRIEPRGTRRIEAARVLDARIEKTFPVGRSSRRFGIFVDLLNLTNQGVPLALTVIEQSSAALGEPTSWATPRTVRIAGRVKF